MIEVEDLVMVEQSNDYKTYSLILHKVCKMVKEQADGLEVSMELYGKLGFAGSASELLKLMVLMRNANKSGKSIQRFLFAMAEKSLFVASMYLNETCESLCQKQLDLYEVKNRRYGNSFRECFVRDGYPYAFGHLQEKINRICSLASSGEVVEDEPLVDSYKDLLGYCVLTIMETYGTERI